MKKIIFLTYIFLIFNFTYSEEIKLKTKEDIVEFFNHLSIQTTNSYTDKNLHDVVNISKVQEKILLALSDFNSNVNATLVLEKFLFTILLDNNIGIVQGEEDNPYPTVVAAQTADMMLSMENIDASFVVTKREDGRIGISGRSLGNKNVQRVMEKMGGGGHLSNAATQLSDITIEEAVTKLFDLTPNGIQKSLNLRKPSFRYQDLAAFGHIGRTDIDLPWEKLDKVEGLKQLKRAEEVAALRGISVSDLA